MITLIEPESGLMDCVGPKLEASHQEFTVIGLKDFCHKRTIEFGRHSSLKPISVSDRYWLGADISSISKDLLQTFCDLDDASLWVNEPIRAWQAQYFGYQLRLAELSGFTVPNTIITNNESDILSFQERYSQEFIQIEPDAFNADVQIFRQRINAGKHVRVYVFGANTFAFDLGPFREMHELADEHSSSAQYLTALNPLTTRSLSRFMRMSRLDFGIFDLCLKNKQDAVWVNFSTDIETLARDEKRFPFAGLCDALAETLIKSTQ